MGGRCLVWVVSGQKWMVGGLSRKWHITVVSGLKWVVTSLKGAVSDQKWEEMVVMLE